MFSSYSAPSEPYLPVCFPRLTEINWHDERVKNILIHHVVDKLDVDETLNRLEVISGVRTTKRILQQRARRQRENLIKSGVLKEEGTLISSIQGREESSPESIDSSLESIENFDFDFDVMLSPSLEFNSLDTFPDEFVMPDFSLEPVFRIRQVEHTLLPITMRYPVKFDPLYTKELLIQFSEAVRLAFHHLRAEEVLENEKDLAFLTSENHMNVFRRFLLDMTVFHLIFSHEADLQDPKMNTAYNALIQTVVAWIMNNTHQTPPGGHLPQIPMTRWQFRRLLMFVDCQMGFLTQLIENYLNLDPQFEEVVVKYRTLVSFVYSALGGIGERLIDTSINTAQETEWTVMACGSV